MDSRLINYVPLVISAIAVLTVAFMTVKTGLISLPFGKGKPTIKSGSLKSVSQTKSSSSKNSSSSESDSKDTLDDI